MTDSIRLDDTTTVQYTVTDETGAARDISAATGLEFTFQHESTKITRNGSFLTNGTDGVVVYTLAAADFDVAGVWQVQLKITTAAGSWKTPIGQIRVDPVL